MQMQLELIKVDSNKLGGFFDHCLDSKIEAKGKKKVNGSNHQLAADHINISALLVNELMQPQSSLIMVWFQSIRSP